MARGGLRRRNPDNNRLLHVLQEQRQRETGHGVQRLLLQRSRDLRQVLPQIVTWIKL